IAVSNADIRIYLEQKNIESRHLWKPMHMQPIFQKHPFYGDGTSETIFNQGLCLPSGSSLTDDDINRVVKEIRSII
ncbi:MAG TPA: DegT/DnrJ/EryC1/StrS family aminotransferase, partial [Bacteroidales bacterium]|nr:DegT/DnrJ/EryC1/StrS family aminotransferase [Bacteroidales bacterium]